jgi:hypothetical protein
VSQRLSEHEVSESGLKVPINDGDREKIECSMCTHHHPDAAHYREDRTEDETSNDRLFDARKPPLE